MTGRSYQVDVAVLVRSGMTSVPADGMAFVLQRSTAGLAERGEVSVLGETLKSDRLKQIGAELFDPKGRVLDVSLVVEVLLLPKYPTWSPAYLVESPWTSVGIACTLLAAAVSAVWLGVLPGFLGMVGATTLISAVGLLAGRPSVAFVATGMAGLVVSFTLLMRTLLLVLGGRAGFAAVGQTETAA